MRIAFVLATLVLAAPGCSLTRPPDAGDCMCTMEFRMVHVRVVDSDGQPVTGLTPVVRNERTGRTLDVSHDGGALAPGTYTVVSDSNVEDVSEAGDRLTFRATGGGRTAEGVFVVARDACSCHIDRREGPEEIVAR